MISGSLRQVRYFYLFVDSYCSLTYIEYSLLLGLTDRRPQLPTATYRYNATSGAVFVVDDTLKQPNGIAFNPDASIVYISDTGMSHIFCGL